MQACLDCHMATSAVKSISKEAGQQPKSRGKVIKLAMILSFKNANGSFGFLQIGKLVSQTIDTQQFGVPLNGATSRQTTSQHPGKRCRQVPLKIGGRIPGGASQHGVMTTSGSGIRTRTSSAQK